MSKAVQIPLLPQKGNCKDCPWYTDCPRMRGHNTCFSSPAYQQQDVPSFNDEAESQQCTAATGADQIQTDAKPDLQ